MKKTALITILFAASLVNTNVLSEGNLARQRAITVNVSISEVRIRPQNITFETGKLYKLVIENEGSDEIEIESDTISNLAYTRKIQIKKVAEIKGTPSSIEIRPFKTIEWWFVPVATTYQPGSIVVDEARGREITINFR